MDEKLHYLDDLFYYACHWIYHVAIIAFWVLLGAACLLLLLRYLLLKLFPQYLNPYLLNYSSPKLNLLMLALLLCLIISVFYALKPDVEFLTYFAERSTHHGDYEEALPVYEQVINLGAGRLEDYNNIAICYFHLGRYREAIQAFHHVQAVAPDISIYIYTICAQAHEEINEPDIAIAHLTKALSIAESPKEKNEIQLQLQSLRRNHPNIE